MAKFEIWCEGFSIQGNDGEATKLGEAEGLDFNEAVLNFMSQEPKHEIIKRGNHWETWGCELFPTEKQARVAFG